MSPSMRRAAIGAGLLIAIMLGTAWLFGLFGSHIGPDERQARMVSLPDNVSQTPVASVTEPASEWASGTLQSASRTAVSSRILARIEDVKVAAGDRVKTGDVLVELDARELRARAEQAREAQRAAVAKRELAKAEMERADELLKRGVGTGKRYDEAVSALGVAKAEVDRATRALEEAETAFSYAVIRSTVDGRVIDRLAEPGDTAAPGTPLLRVYDPSRLRVEAPVRESLAVRLDVGMRLGVVIPALNERFEGVIDEIVPFAEPGARTLLVQGGASWAAAALFRHVCTHRSSRWRADASLHSIAGCGGPDRSTRLCECAWGRQNDRSTIDYDRRGGRGWTAGSVERSQGGRGRAGASYRNQRELRCITARPSSRAFHGTRRPFWVISRPEASPSEMSALPPRADMELRGCDVRS